MEGVSDAIARAPDDDDTREDLCANRLFRFLEQARDLNPSLFPRPERPARRIAFEGLQVSVVVVIRRLAHLGPCGW